MGKITKDIFISTIEAIHSQITYDRDQHYALYTALKVEDSVLPLYDNSIVIKALIALLQVSFPKDENGFCDIEHYCYDLNFGNVSEDEYISVDELWNTLTKEISEVCFYAHPLIDDGN